MRGRPRQEQESGFTLVEVLVAFAVLSIVLTATAASLITFTRTSVENERRVQATAVLNTLHEDLQAIPWPDAELYADEIGPLSQVGVVEVDGVATFEGNPLAVRDGPGCAPDDDCRVAIVPHAYEVVDGGLDERTYEVFRIITDVPRGGEDAAFAAAEVKRFTTIVRWETLGGTVEQRFDSERAPTPAEFSLANVPAVTQFLITPDEVNLDADGRTLQSASVEVRFRDETTSAALTVPVLVEVPPEEGDPEAEPVYAPSSIQVSLTAVGDRRYTGTLPAQLRMAEGERSIRVDGTRPGDGSLATTTTTITVLPHDPEFVVVDPPTVHEVTVNRVTNTIARFDGGNRAHQFCAMFEVRARVSGLTPDEGGVPQGASVTAFYSAASAQGAGMVPEMGVTGTNDWFRLRFPAGAASPWRPSSQQGQTGPTTMHDAFSVTARNDGGPQATLTTSPAVAFSGTTNNNGRC